MIDLTLISVNRDTSLRDALKRLDASSCGILLLVDVLGVFERTVTDGDIRRLLLNGLSLDSTLSLLPNIQSCVLPEAFTRLSALQLMNENSINHIPVVNEHGHVVRLINRIDIDQKILLSTPHLGDLERQFVEEAFRTNWIAPLGPNVDGFERELADLVGVAHAAALSSGTAALHLALVLLGVGRGDVVFCSTLTFVASANPVLYQGAEPVFIDSEPLSWNMSPSALEDAFRDAHSSGKMPKAVIVVNLYGQSADFDSIIEICSSYNVPIIEDAAESLGSYYKERPSGSFGKIGVFSFNGNKIITTSGGGMLVSDDESIVSRARFLSTQAREPKAYYEHNVVGYNYRMSNILAGVGRGQLTVLRDRVYARRNVFRRYQEALSSFCSISWMPEPDWSFSNRWLTALTIESEVSHSPVEHLINRLALQGIEARHVWKPMHLQPLFKGSRFFPHEGASFSEYLFDHGLCLPSGSNMSEQQQSFVVESLSALLNEVSC